MENDSRGGIAGMFWPQIRDRDSAKSTALGGAVAAGLVASVTALLSLPSYLGSRGLFGHEPSPMALVDAATFAAIAWGIKRMSRIAACSGLLLFGCERVWGYTQTGRSGGPVAIMLLLWFIGGVRGTIAFHRFKPIPGEVGDPTADLGSV